MKSTIAAAQRSDCDLQPLFRRSLNDVKVFMTRSEIVEHDRNYRAQFADAKTLEGLARIALAKSTA